MVVIKFIIYRGRPRQIPKHIILSYPSSIDREAMLLAAGTENYNILLLTQKGIEAVTWWLIG